MNYVYDILLNFNEKFYDFYDWNVRDLIDHMRKIPIFKVSKNVLEDFLNYDIKIEKEFLDKWINVVPFCLLVLFIFNFTFNLSLKFFPAPLPSCEHTTYLQDTSPTSLS